MRHIITIATGLVFSMLVAIPIASAHVVVLPSQVELGAFITFTTSVPNEKEIATTSLRLVVPDGLHHVTPTVKPGWTITEQKDGDTIKEITWSGGEVPEGRRDDFSFSAQAPSTAGTIIWKAYQGYSDGTVVSWDQESGEAPASKTSIQEVDDTALPVPDNTSLALSISALVVAVASLGLSLRR